MDSLQYFEEEYITINDTVSKILSLSVDSISNYKDFISTQKSFIESLFNIPEMSQIDTESFTDLLDNYVSQLNISVDKFNKLIRSLKQISSSFESSNFIK